ncbi:MAG: DNA topoisomerase IB [Frankiales bacterium]|nr:DNA topoisomerase IB [Frankiales bacterium]
MVRLARVSCQGPGLSRVRRGTGFAYRDPDGRPVTDPVVLERIRSLVIPPAWQQVWICQVTNGHIQATGIDARGRRQYQYHDAWRLQRDLAKHDRILDFAGRLPAARQRMHADLAVDGLGRTRVLACAVRLIDLGFFRIGGEQYASENQSYGLATLRKEHVRLTSAGELEFEYIGKSGRLWQRSLAEPEVGRVVSSLKRRRGGGPELLAFRDSGRWVDVKSGDINAYLREVTGGDDTAKDFRTWSATVLAAVGLAVSTHADTSAARTRAITRVVKEVADKLGNTPAVCRASYIDPRIIDLYADGQVVELSSLGDGASLGSPAFQGAIETAVLALLREPAASSRLAG